MSPSIFGTVVQRVEDPRLLTGRSGHVDERRVEGALRAEFVRSIIAHARLAGATVLTLGLLGSACGGAERLTSALTSSPSPAPQSPAPSPVSRGAIAIRTPLPGDEVGSPVSVTGTADVPGAMVQVRVLDGSGVELAATVVPASCGGGCVGTFGVELFFFTPERRPGTIEVSAAPGGGSSAFASVPVVLAPA